MEEQYCSSTKIRAQGWIGIASGADRPLKSCNAQGDFLGLLYHLIVVQAFISTAARSFHRAELVIVDSACCEHPSSTLLSSLAAIKCMLCA